LVYETIEEKFQNVLKEKTELEHLLKEYMEMDELFSGDEKLTLHVKKFKEEFTKGFCKDKERAGTSGVGNGDGNEDGADNNEVDVAEENEATEIPNGNSLRKCILEGPYTPSTVIIPVVHATDNSPVVPE
ncbi:hypothetical protein Tco_1422712, partial [Tanacetum coccineum]